MTTRPLLPHQLPRRLSGAGVNDELPGQWAHLAVTVGGRERVVSAGYEPGLGAVVGAGPAEP